MKKLLLFLAVCVFFGTVNAQVTRTTGNRETGKNTLNGVNAQKARSFDNFALNKKVQVPMRAITATTFLSENFDAETLTGWTHTPSTSGLTRYWQQGNPESNTFSAIESTNVASLIHGYLDGTNLNNIFYKTVNLASATSEVSVNFWVGYSGPWMTGGSQTSTQYPGADVRVVVSTNGGSSWTKIWAYTDSHNGTESWLWENYTVSLASYAGQSILLGLQYTGNGGDLAAIDNVYVVEGCNNSFTTAAVAQVSGSTITTTWAISTAPASYIVEVNGEEVTNPPAGTATSYQFTTPNDGPYTITVKAVYNDCPSISSQTSVIVGTPCTWSIYMEDYYGDPWEGAVVVWQNGIVTNMLYMEDGSVPETQTFDVYNGPIEIWWVEGTYFGGDDYDDEDFVIYDNNGTVIFTTNGEGINPSGTNPNEYIEFIYTGVVNCGGVVSPIAVSSLTPVNNATSVAITAPVSVTFNQNVTAGTLTGITINGNPATASVSGNKLTIEHGNFDYNTPYTVSVPVGAINDYNQAITWSFTTVTQSSIPVVNGNEINIFQNNGKIFVKLSENSDVRLLDIYGRVLGNYNVAANATLTVNQPVGIYLIEVRSNGNVSTHKVVVK